MTKCPNKSLDTYKHLEEVLGEGRALAAWTLHGEDKIPTPKEAIQLLYPNVHPVDNYETMDFGSWAGKYEPDYEKQIENFILNHPDKPINGADSFNSFLDRSLGHFSHLLKTAPDNTVVVTHSSVLKAIRLWDEAGRPENLRLSNEDYVKEETQTGTVEPYKGANGTIWVVRHGETEDNKKENLRGPDTRLTDKGIKQAKEAGKELSDIQISELYCSPLDRAIHTTDLIMSQQEQPKQKPVGIESRLHEFTKGLGFETKHIDELKELTGLDAVSATDLMNKVVLYGKHAGLDHIAKETAYVAYAMLGRKNKIITDLKQTIDQIPNYQQIFQHYKDKNSQLSDGKIKELIIVDFIAV